MSIRHHHLSASIAISVTLVTAAFFALLFWFRPWDTPNRVFDTMLDVVTSWRNYALHTTGDVVVKGAQESFGVTYRLDGVVYPRADALANYSFTLNGSGTFRSAQNVRSTFTGTIDARIVAGRAYMRLVDFQLSNDLKPRFQEYVSVYRGVWYRLPEEALGRAVRGDSATLTDFARLMGLIRPLDFGSSRLAVTVGFEPKILAELVQSYVHARGALPPDSVTHQKTGENPTGGQAIWSLDQAGAPGKIDGKFSTDTDALGGSLLTATFSTALTPNTKAELPVAPERPVDYDIRQILR